MQLALKKPRAPVEAVGTPEAFQARAPVKPANGAPDPAAVGTVIPAPQAAQRYRPLLPALTSGPAAPLTPAASTKPVEAREPDIEITIGRIDVRAAPERRAPPGPAARPAPPLMSLDAYLSKGRGRRA
jgi:hypothetical protein